MKNIKFLALSLFAVLIFSCTEDDSDNRRYVDGEAKTELVGTIALSRTSAAPGTMVSFTYTLPQSFSVESTLEARAISNVSITGAPYQTIAQITVPAGTTTGTGMIEMPGNPDWTADYAGYADYATIWLSGIALTQPADGSVDDPFVLSSEPASIAALQNNPPFMSAVDQVLMLSLDWEGPYGGGENDLDMYVVSVPGGALFESAESGDRFEGDFFNNPANEAHPDGDYEIQVGIWTSVGPSVPWRLTLTHPDGSVDQYEGVADMPNQSVVAFTKTTDGAGNATYVTSAL